MRPGKRFWRFTFYASVVGCVIILATYLISLRFVTGWYGSRNAITLDWGCIVLWRGFIAFNAKPGFQFERAHSHAIWEFRVHHQGHVIFTPLWFPLLLFASLTAFAWFRSRQQRLPGRCASCVYDLTGNVTGRCPECGTAAGA